MTDFNPNNSVENQLFNQSSIPTQPQSQPRGDNAEIEQIASIITDLDRRLRILEERYSNIRKKLQLTDQNILESERGFVKELKIINDDALKLKKQVNDYSEKISIFTDEINQAAKKTDVKLIEKYLDLWDPKNFVTRKELKEYLKQKENFPPILIKDNEKDINTEEHIEESER